VATMISTLSRSFRFGYIQMNKGVIRLVSTTAKKNGKHW
jgi:hypothetical protein